MNQVEQLETEPVLVDVNKGDEELMIEAYKLVLEEGAIMGQGAQMGNNFQDFKAIIYSMMDQGCHDFVLAKEDGKPVAFFCVSTVSTKYIRLYMRAVALNKKTGKDSVH